jgi:hypothetical protein
MTTHYQCLPERGAALSLVVESRLPSGSRVRLRSKEVACIFVVGFDLCETSPLKRWEVVRQAGESSPWNGRMQLRSMFPLPKAGFVNCGAGVLSPLLFWISTIPMLLSWCVPVFVLSLLAVSWTTEADPDNLVLHCVSVVVGAPIYTVSMVHASTCWKLLNDA